MKSTKLKSALLIISCITLPSHLHAAKIFGSELDNIHSEIRAYAPVAFTIIFIIGVGICLAQVNKKGWDSVIGYIIVFVITLGLISGVLSYISSKTM